MSYSVQDVTNGRGFFGFIENLLVSSTPIQVPAIGINPSSPSIFYDALSLGHLRVVIAPVLSSSAIALNVTLKDLTNGNFQGPLPILPGEVTKSFDAPFVVNPEDHVVLEFSVEGSSTTLSQVQWYSF